MGAWLTRPGYIALFAFLAGGALAAALVLILTRGGDDDGGTTPRATSTAVVTTVLTPGATLPAGTAAPAATATPGAFTDPDTALADYVANVMHADYIGECSGVVQVGAVCSRELERTADLLAATLGLSGSEFSTELVITRNEDNTWTVSAFPIPSGAVPIAVGEQVIVHGAGSCLRFRSEPGLAAGVATCQLDGTRGTVDDGPQVVDDITWWHVQDFGWASEEFLGVPD